MFIQLDKALIDRVFQPLCESALPRLGIGRAAAACLCMDAAALAWIVSRAGRLSAAMTTAEGDAAAMSLAMVLLGLAALVGLRIILGWVNRGGGSNPLRYVMRPHRAIVLLMLLARLAALRSVSYDDAADLAMLALAGVALFMGACAEPGSARRGRALNGRRFA